MNREAVITGIGVVLPKTRTLDGLWRPATADQPSIIKISDKIKSSVIDPGLIANALPSRLAKKLDVFTHYALVAVQSAIADAEIDLPSSDLERCGVFVGNCFGGWRFTEEELRHLHLEGPRAVSPFQATSWFPAAPQGQITIAHGIKGFSKTYMSDRMSSLVSVATAARCIRSGSLDAAIAGGTESTNSDFVRAALSTIGAANGVVDPSAIEFAISEGAVFLVLEEAEAARMRGARIYAKVDAFAMRTAACRPDQYGADSAVLKKTMASVLRDRQPDIILSDASGLPRIETCEKTAIAEICPDVPTLTPKHRFGHTFGAEGALDIAFASLMLHRQSPLPAELHADASTKVPSLRDGTPLGHILVNACALGGSSSSLLLSREK